MARPPSSHKLSYGTKMRWRRIGLDQGLQRRPSLMQRLVKRPVHERGALPVVVRGYITENGKVTACWGFPSLSLCGEFPAPPEPRSGDNSDRGQACTGDWPRHSKGGSGHGQIIDTIKFVGDSLIRETAERDR